MARDDEEPKYTVYRSRRKLFGRRDDEPRNSGAAGLQELRERGAAGAAPPPDRPPVRTAPAERDAGRGTGRDARRDAGRGRLGGGSPAPGDRRRRITRGRVVKWLVLACLGWLGLSLLLFLVSAQIQRANTTEAAREALSPSGYTLTSPNTILVLGSDARTESTAEPGSSVGGPSRADSILLLRVGGGRSARLSIPRDTVVDIPGHGRDKVNAAYAIGGPSLTILTLEEYLGIDINHIVEVDFENFPQFIDALGGITVSTGCVQSDINGGRRNGGFSLRLRAGRNHINGRQALALARTRRNNCRPNENDLTRARRQQKIMAAIKDRLVSPVTFLRAPWVAWAAPKAIKSDMAGPALLGLFGAVVTGGDPAPRLLEPSGGVTLPDGGAGLVVSEEEKSREVRAFLRG